MSSLLSLDADVWSCISVFLGPSDLPRLLIVGNRTLMTRLKSGVRSINLEWLSYRYIDLDQVFTSILKLDNATSVTFRQPTNWIRCWTPVNWSLLSTSLTSLSLTFLGAPSVFLNPERPHSILGSLRHLVLEDLLSKVMQNVEENTSEISLLRLPPALLSLAIRSRRYLRFSVEELEQSLPPCLEDLELFFPVVFMESDRLTTMDGGGTQATFPCMSQPLRRLKVLDGSDQHWLIRFEDLPVTLETFHFAVHQWRAVQPTHEANRHPCSIIDLRGAKKLVNLKTLRATDLVSKVMEVMPLLPSSLTELDLDFQDEDDEQLDEAVALLGPKLTDLVFCGVNGVVSAFLSGDGPRLFPKVHTLNVYNSYAPYSRLPDNLTSLTHCTDDIPDSLPLSIRRYTLVTPYGENSIIPTLPWTPQHLNLESLTLPLRPLPACWYESLPPSLLKLKTRLSAIDCEEFLQYLTSTAGTNGEPNSIPSSSPSTCSRLPNLEIFKNEAVVRWHCLGLLSSSSMPRLRKVRLDIAESFISNTPACMSTLEALASSNVEHMSLKVRFKRSFMEGEMVVPLLNHLPRGLKSLRFASSHYVESSWPVKLPSTLQSLQMFRLRISSAADGVNVDREGEKCATPKGIDSFQFPPSLVLLAMNTHSLFPLETLPPHLSLCYMSRSQIPCMKQLAMTKVEPKNRTLFELNYYPDRDYEEFD